LQCCSDRFGCVIVIPGGSQIIGLFNR
jgi:hypothetical protein